MKEVLEKTFYEENIILENGKYNEILKEFIFNMSLGKWRAWQKSMEIHREIVFAFRRKLRSGSIFAIPAEIDLRSGSTFISLGKGKRPRKTKYERC